jgi:type IV pilus assembly protein PilC
MPSFVFRVGTPDGQVVERQVEAVDLRAARDEIQRQGLHIFNVRQRGFSVRSLLPGGKIISTERFLVFNQELLALVRAGLPIVQSFDLMLERQKNPRFRQVLAEIRDKIKSGVALSDAFAFYGRAFPPIYSTSLRAGERSGDLEGVLRRFLRYQKLIVNLQKRVTSAMVYPAVVISVSVIMVFVMLTYVMPKFADFYVGFGAELPVVTRTVMALSTTMRENVLFVLAGIAAAVWLLRRWSRSEIGGAAWDSFLLRLPLVGGILHRFAMMQFTQSLSTLLSGGTPMVPAIEIGAQSVGNRYIGERIAGIAQNVREGEPLWHSLESTGVMSDLAIEMIKVGESTGALTEMLNNVSEFYDEEIDARLSRMITLLEPIILIVLGIIISVLLYAFYMPLFQLTNLQG